MVKQTKKSVMLTNGINTKSDIEALKRGHDIEERNSSLSLTDLEVIANIPVKELSKKNGLTLDHSEIGFARVPKGSSNGKLYNGDVNMVKRSSKNNHNKKSIDTEDELSDSEESTASSRISQDSSPKTTARNAKCEGLQSKLKDEQSSR